MNTYDKPSSNNRIRHSTPFFSKGGDNSFFQTKLTIGQPGDKYELEADAMADQVVRQSNTPSVQQKCSACEQDDGAVLPKLQRMGEMGEEEDMQMKSENGEPATASEELSSQLNSSKGGGHTLPDNTRSEMESSFGVDFSNVKVHTGQQAVQMNQNLNAQAFTHGNNVYFNQGKYSPDTSSGRHLLAHELTHVVQQGAAS